MQLTILKTLMFLALTFSASSYGLELRQIPDELKDENILPNIVYLEVEDDEKCYSQFLEGVLKNIKSETYQSNSATILNILKNLKFSPNCFWQTTLSKAKNEADLVLGFTTGNVVEASFGLGLPLIFDLASLGVEKGLELSIVRYGQNRLMVGLVKSGGIELNAVSLPVGISPVQGIIRGQCDRGINSYLGSFLEKLLLQITVLASMKKISSAGLF